MTSPHSTFGKFVGKKHSRRDLILASAVAAAAATFPIGIHAAAQTPSATPPTVPETADLTLRLPLNAFGQQVSIDPHRTVNWGPFWVMLPYAWSGLLRFDEYGAVQTDLAESFEPNADGSVWTAKLKNDIAFADGTPITSQHFIDSWHRALDATELSPMSAYFAPIVGAVERSAGENISLGVTAVDSKTLKISLTEPLAHFPSYLATFGYAVVHPKYLATESAIEVGQACSGPWMITEHSDSVIRMAPNPHHWDSKSADIAAIEWAIAPTGNTDQAILDWFRTDVIAIADLPIGVLEGLAADDPIRSTAREFDHHGATYALAMDFHQAPFNDVRVRRAVASAIDRESWSAEIQMGTYIAANSFSPDVLNVVANYQAPTDAFDDDPVELLKQANLDPATNENEIVLFQTATDSPGAMDRTAALVAMINQATGLTITHDTMLTTEQITAARQDAGGLQMQLIQWQIDSEVPSLLGIASQSSAYNEGWFNWEPVLEDSGDFTPGADAALFDEKVTAARASMDETERNTLYAEAEQLLLKNAVLVPIGFWNPKFLQKEWLVGTRQGPWSGSIPVRIDGEVTIDRDAMPRESTPEA